MPNPQLRSSLVTTETVAATLGLSNEQVIALADSDYQWVWDVSARSQKSGGKARRVRELRFWAREVIAPDSVGTLTRTQVLGLILGNRAKFAPGDVNRLLCVSTRTRLDLHFNDLHRDHEAKFYTRAALIFFLLKRLIHQPSK